MRRLGDRRDGRRVQDVEQLRRVCDPTGLRLVQRYMHGRHVYGAEHRLMSELGLEHLRLRSSGARWGNADGTEQRSVRCDERKLQRVSVGHLWLDSKHAFVPERD